MRRISLRIYTTAVICLAAVSVMHAQETGSDLGPQNVVVQREYEPVITEAHKIMDSPVMDDSIPPSPKLSYQIVPKQVPVNFQVEPITPANMKGEPLVKLYRHLAKAGLGNYNTPYAEYWLNNLRSKKMLLAANAKHISSKADMDAYGEALSSHNHASAFGKFFLPTETIKTDVLYQRQGYKFYGFNRDFDDLFLSAPDVGMRKIYNLFEIKGAAVSSSGDSAKLNHHADLGYYYFTDNYKGVENQLNISGGVNKFVNTELFGGNVNFTYFTNSVNREFTNLAPQDGFILSFNPYVSMKKKKIITSLGALVAIESDSATSTFFYPDVKAEYRIVDEVFTLYGELTGGPVRNTYRKLSDENPFISTYVNLQNTRERLGAKAGIKGRISSDLTYNASVKYASVENQYFYDFFEGDLLENSFNVIYDDTKEWKASGGLGYHMGEKMLVELKGNYYSYKTDKEQRAWYRPNFDLNLSGRYDMASKIILKADLFFIGARYGRVNLLEGTEVISGERKLNGYADLNLGVEYRYSKRLGMFLNLNNLAGSRYFRWVNYPVYRLNFLAGISYSF